MKQINKKYIEDFERLTLDWQKLAMKPSQEYLYAVMQDLEQMQRDLKNIKL